MIIPILNINRTHFYGCDHHICSHTWMKWMKLKLRASVRKNKTEFTGSVNCQQRIRIKSIKGTRASDQFIILYDPVRMKMSSEEVFNEIVTTFLT